MISVEITVTYTDGREATGRSNVRDEVAFERHFDLSLAALARPEPHMEWVYFIAWQVLHRTGQELGEFEPFLDLIDTIGVKVDPKTGPTQPVPQPGP